MPPDAEVAVLCRRRDGAQRAGAARTKDRRPRVLHNKTVIPHRPWGRQPEVEGSPGLVSSEACLLGLYVPSSHGLPVRAPVLTSSSCTDTSLMGPVPRAHYDFILTQLTSLKTLSPNTVSL